MTSATTWSCVVHLSSCWWTMGRQGAAATVANAPASGTNTCPWRWRSWSRRTTRTTRTVWRRKQWDMDQPVLTKPNYLREPTWHVDLQVLVQYHEKLKFDVQARLHAAINLNKCQNMAFSEAGVLAGGTQADAAVTDAAGRPSWCHALVSKKEMTTATMWTCMVHLSYCWWTMGGVKEKTVRHGPTGADEAYLPEGTNVTRGPAGSCTI